MQTTLLEGAHRVSCTPGLREKSSDPIRDWARPTCQYRRVSCRSGGRLCLTVGTKTLAAAVLGSAHWCEPSRRPPLAPPNSLQASVLGHLRPNNQQGRNRATPTADKQLKDFLSKALFTKGQDPAPPTTGQEPVPSIKKPAQASQIASATRGQTAEARRITILQPAEQKLPPQEVRKMS